MVKYDEIWRILLAATKEMHISCRYAPLSRPDVGDADRDEVVILLDARQPEQSDHDVADLVHVDTAANQKSVLLRQPITAHLPPPSVSKAVKIQLSLSSGVFSLFTLLAWAIQ